MPLLKLIPTASGVALSFLIFAFSASAQNLNVQRIQEQQGVIAGLRTEISSNVGDTKKLIEDFQSGLLTGDAAAIEGLFSHIEADTRTVLRAIALDSELRKALDGMRAQIDTLISRSIREPESSGRDRNLARLQELKEIYQAQYDSVGSLEQRLIGRLSELNREKRDVLFALQIDHVELVVESLQSLVNNLESLEGEIDAVANAVIQDPVVSQ